MSPGRGRRIRSAALGFFSLVAAAGCAHDRGERRRCWVVVEKSDPDVYEAPEPHTWLHTHGEWIHGWTGVGEAPGWILQIPWVVWDAYWEMGVGREGKGMGSAGDFVANGVGLFAFYPLTLAGRTVSWTGGTIAGGAAAALRGLVWDLGLSRLAGRRPASGAKFPDEGRAERPPRHLGGGPL